MTDAVVATGLVLLRHRPRLACDLFEGHARTDERGVVTKLVVRPAVQRPLLRGRGPVAGEKGPREVHRVALEGDRVGVEAHQVAVGDHACAALLEVGERVRAALEQSRHDELSMASHECAHESAPDVDLRHAGSQRGLHVPYGVHGAARGLPNVHDLQRQLHPANTTHQRVGIRDGKALRPQRIDRDEREAVDGQPAHLTEMLPNDRRDLVRHRGRLARR